MLGDKSASASLMIVRTHCGRC